MTGYVASQFLSKRLYAVSTPPVLPKEHTDLPFDVKALTRIPKEFADHERSSSLIPLCVNKGKHADVLPLKSERKLRRLPVCCLKGNFSSSRSDVYFSACLKSDYRIVVWLSAGRLKATLTVS